MVAITARCVVFNHGAMGLCGPKILKHTTDQQTRRHGDPENNESHVPKLELTSSCFRVLEVLSIQPCRVDD